MESEEKLEVDRSSSLTMRGRIVGKLGSEDEEE